MAAPRLVLPGPGTTTRVVTLGEGPSVPAIPTRPPTSRVAYAAAHVVADPLADVDPREGVALDWDATLAFRRHLWAQGLGVAEAMDTAQRGMGLDWPTTRTLIRRTLAEAAAEGGLVACGIATDQLTGPTADLDAIAGAYEEQLEMVEDLGGTAVVMASRALAATAGGPHDYAEVYGRLLGQVTRPVILHWLGEAFDPLLAGYWGDQDLHKAADALLEIVADHPHAVDGVKVSVLDEEIEVAFRARLPEGVRCYTGDDFHFPQLILGDDTSHSDALLGIFDPIAAVARAAFESLDRGDVAGWTDLLAPTVPLSRHLFGAPTYRYKTGVVFLAHLAGHQDHFRMVGGEESSRSIRHLAELVVLADRAGALPDPDRAAHRARRVLELAGVAQ